MSDSLLLLVDPVFAQPFLTGLAYAVLLPLVGAYLRLRDEWLAALAFAQTAAAGALLAMLAGLPLLLGGAEGAEMRQPLGLTIIGGLLLSQILTLYTTPVVYLYLDRLRHRFNSWRGVRTDAALENSL